MEKYIVIVDLPDAHVGTEVIWNAKENNYQYAKNQCPAPHGYSYLTDEQVVNNPKYFCKADQYPEYYAYHNPVYSRKEILELVNSFGFRNTSHAQKFENNLRELGKKNAEKLMKNK